MSEPPDRPRDLELEYSARRSVPEHPTIFAAWAAASAEARGRLQVRLDLAYGPQPAERLDLFPAGPGAPLLIYVHGGYWRSMDKSDFSFLAPPWVEAGVAFASLNHTLAPEAGLAEIVDQIRRGVAFLYREAGQLGFDPQRMVAVGHSAGGHLVAMLLATDWPAFGLAADPLRGAAAISGLFDLLPLLETSVNDALRLDSEAARRLSPIHLPIRSRARAVLSVGGAEPPAFHEQTRRYAAHLRARSILTRLVVQPGAHHFRATETVGEPGSPLFEALRELILG